jgi:hypothetical protein
MPRVYRVPITPTERRFASGLLAPPCFLAVARKMRADGRADLFVTMPTLDGSIMRQLLILVDTQVSAGITDVVLDCAAVRGEDVTRVGLGYVVKLANELRALPRRGTLTLSIVSAELAVVLDSLPRLGHLVVTAFPSVPTSLESYG